MENRKDTEPIIKSIGRMTETNAFIRITNAEDVEADGGDSASDSPESEARQSFHNELIS